MDEDFKVRHALSGYKSPEYDLGFDLDDSDDDSSNTKDNHDKEE